MKLHDIYGNCTVYLYFAVVVTHYGLNILGIKQPRDVGNSRVHEYLKLNFHKKTEE